MEQNNEVLVNLEFQGELQTVLETIPEVITTDQEYEAATASLLAITKKRKQVQDWLQSCFVDPAKEVYTAARNAWHGAREEAEKPLSSLRHAENLIGERLKIFILVKEAKKRALQAELDEQAKAQHEQARAKAREPGKTFDLMPEPPKVAPVKKTTKTLDGALTMKAHYQVEVVDESLIPDEFMVITKTVNRPKIVKAFKHDITVPGTKVIETKSLVTTPA